MLIRAVMVVPAMWNGSPIAAAMRSASASTSALVNIGAEHREFVTADSSDHVVAADARLDAPGDGSEQLVSRMVAERVVDGLEPIKVAVQDRPAP
jgi:hypothetical protein